MMTRNTDIQHRAQSEIDRVVGDSRLPDMADRDSLPFVDCVVMELCRFNPPVPLVPHAPIQNDIYNGYDIPKGL